MLNDVVSKQYAKYNDITVVSTYAEGIILESVLEGYA